VGAFVLAAILLSAFFYVESHRASPMLPLSFFRIPTFAASNVVAASVFFALFGTVFFLTLYLQNIQGYSPVAAGIRLFPFTVMILLIAPVAGRLSDRFGSRWFMTGGTALSATGLALLLRTDVGSSYATVILPAFIVLGAGMAMTMAPMTAAVMASVDTRHAGVASAATNTSRELGGVFGIALLTAIVTSAFKRGLLARLLGAGLPASAAERIVLVAGARGAAGGASARAIIQQAPPGTTLEQARSVLAAMQQSFVHAIHVGMIVAISFMLLASVVSAVWVRGHVGEDSEGGVAFGH